MTDAEIRDAAVAEFGAELTELRETTRGLKGFVPPPASRWGKALIARQRALDLLAQIGGVVEPPPPPPTGSVLYEHDYTGTGPPGFGWTDEPNEWGFQAAGAQVAVVPNGYAAGVSSLRMTLPATADWVHAEGLLKRKVVPGERRFYGIPFKLPTDWKEPSTHGWGIGLMQANYQACVNGVVSFFLHADHGKMQILTGQHSWSQTPNHQGIGLTREYNISDGGAQGPGPRFIPTGRLTLGVWHYVIAEVVSAYDSTGLVRVYHKIRGEADFVKTVEKLNIPTLQWGPCNNNLWVIAKGQSYDIADKFGSYSAPANFNRTYEHANILMGDSFEAVKSRML